jgi:hypothetical protein
MLKTTRKIHTSPGEHPKKTIPIIVKSIWRKTPMTVTKRHRSTIMSPRGTASSLMYNVSFNAMKMSYFDSRISGKKHNSMV